MQLQAQIEPSLYRTHSDEDSTLQQKHNRFTRHQCTFLHPTELARSQLHLLLVQTNLEDLNVGDVLEGEVSCMMYFHGVQVDIGAQYDGYVQLLVRPAGSGPLS